MTSRLTRVSRSSKPAIVKLMCPSCRSVRRCSPVGIATIGRRRREVLECSESTCGLQWIPVRDHIVNPT
ncbi:hypothetical protein [Streptacidiphilus carbonis]|uniref:hypothetical protein n=1 Tax=Streptacidiphilus carbonis TaxID=105422 RepID=UPI000B0C748D|nr:hypothetical protein [Streptacidiphilus carbonis]